MTTPDDRVFQLLTFPTKKTAAPVVSPQPQTEELHAAIEALAQRLHRCAVAFPKTVNFTLYVAHGLLDRQGGVQ